MKYIQLIFISSILLMVSSCKKTTACLESDISTAKIGQPIKIHNCSIKYDDLDFETGEENAKKRDERDFENDEISIEYHSSGTFSAKMSVDKKNGKRTDNAIIDITIERADVSELLGEWEYYQVVEDFGYSIILGGNAPTSTSGTINFLSETEFIDLNGYTVDWEFTPSIDKIHINNTYEYFVYKLYNDELILRETNLLGFSYLHYYTKK